MSTAIQAVQQIINDAFSDLQSRIKTGKLRASRKNVILLIERAKEVDPFIKALAEKNERPATAKELADGFYAAIRDTAFARTLDWEVLPNAIRDQNERMKSSTIVTETNQFIDKVRAGETKDARDKRNVDGAKRALELINGFLPTGINGLNRELQEKVQGELTAYVVKAQASDADMSKVAEKVYDSIQREYAKLERARQYSTSVGAAR